MRLLHALGIHYKNKPSMKLADTQIKRAQAGVYKQRAAKRAGLAKRRVEPGADFIK